MWCMWLKWENINHDVTIKVTWWLKKCNWNMPKYIKIYHTEGLSYLLKFCNKY